MEFRVYASEEAVERPSEGLHGWVGYGRVWVSRDASFELAFCI